MPLARQALLVLLLWAPAAASADAVMPPPVGCPPGSIGRSGRMGQYCAPTRCVTAAQGVALGYARPPDPHLECAPAGLCVRSLEVHVGRGRSSPVDVVLAGCTSDAECPDGVVCEITDRCRLQGPLAPEAESARSERADC